MSRSGKNNAVIALSICALVGSGCMVGPNYKRPSAPVAPSWPESGPASAQHGTAEETAVRARWWEVFHDPVLDQLVHMAYRQNITLQVAGLRVLEARAARGIAVGEFFPQLQQINASYSHNSVSQNFPAVTPHYFDNTAATFDVVWELDVWGKFRRGIESADATLYSNVMNYDDALVTLVADVASTYVNLRGLDERIALTEQNVGVQRESLRIANVRFRAGGTTELDVQQARAQLADTQALVPALQQSRQASVYQLCTLLGIPPTQLKEILGAQQSIIPVAPETIAVGIPAELLRRRPDIRRAEGQAAAQCALIGVAEADLLPHFDLFGTIGYVAENPGQLFEASSLSYRIGPGISWDIFNYGRIINNVRVQDARFEQLLETYKQTVLVAQQEVASSISAFLQSRQQAVYLSDSVAAAERAVQIAMVQYKAGGADFIRVLNATQVLVQSQDSLASTRANEALSVIALNRALGGGWELRQDQEFLPPEMIQRMRNRTNWGDVTDRNYEKKSDLVLFPRPNTTVAPGTKP